jgi:hypothetical protein
LVEVTDYIEEFWQYLNSSERIRAGVLQALLEDAEVKTAEDFANHQRRMGEFLALREKALRNV